MTGLFPRTALAVALMFAGLTACVEPPVELSSSYSPENAALSAPDHHLAAGHEACRVSLAGVEDLRDDPESAGVIGYRFVRANDAVAWLRSGLLSSWRDPSLDISDQAPANSSLAIKVDLLKIYMLPINEAKSAQVVVKVHYIGPSASADDQIYRGTYTSMNWADGAGETQGAFDRALAVILNDVHRDLLARCAGGSGRAAS